MSKKKDMVAILIYMMTFLVIYYFLTGNEYIFASKTDFESQHYLIPEYFRKMFYETHDLFPDFAFNLGSGQNIYYFSYYGLLNPIILISYLFPYISMIDYLIFSNCLIVLSSVVIFYVYLKKHDVSFKVRFTTAFLFLTSGPLIFHAHRHLMFINYMPFLILALYGVDRYYDKKKIGLLIFSITMMIFTSYYYSVSGIVAIYIYMIYTYLSKVKKIDVKEMFTHCFNIIYPFIISIMIGAVIILPTFYTLLNGREKTVNTFEIGQLFIPSLEFLYSHYSVGLTFIAFISMIYMSFHKKKKNKFLAISCLMICCFPLFNYIFNGTLYINGKSLIPFLPLILIIVSKCLSMLFKKTFNIKQFICIGYLLLSSFLLCLAVNQIDELMKKDEITNIDHQITTELIEDIIREDQSFYRINNQVFKGIGMNYVSHIDEYKTTLYSSTYNNGYYHFYTDVINNPIPYRNCLMHASSNNLLSQILLNEKYIVSKAKLPLSLSKEKQGIKIYQNEYALPIGYASAHVLNEKEFNKIPYPSNVLALLDNIVVKDVESSNEIQALSPIELSYEIVEQQNITIMKTNNIYEINASDSANLMIKLHEELENKLLLIRFSNQINPTYDTSITINGVKNKLTDKNWKYHNANQIFDYVLHGKDTLTIHFTKGKYQLNELELYILDLNDIKQLSNHVDEFHINKKLTKGDKIVGTVDVTKENSFFTISIPYDKGFKIVVDGKSTTYEKVNTSFIGFPLSKGKHDIIIEYEAPFKKVSLIISAIGLLLALSPMIKVFSRKIKDDIINYIVGGKND